MMGVLCQYTVEILPRTIQALSSLKGNQDPRDSIGQQEIEVWSLNRESESATAVRDMGIAFYPGHHTKSSFS